MIIKRWCSHKAAEIQHFSRKVRVTVFWLNLLYYHVSINSLRTQKDHCRQKRPSTVTSLDTDVILDRWRSFKTSINSHVTQNVIVRMIINRWTSLKAAGMQYFSRKVIIAIFWVATINIGYIMVPSLHSGMIMSLVYDNDIFENETFRLRLMNKINLLDQWLFSPCVTYLTIE